MGSHSATCHPTKVNAPLLNPSQRPVAYWIIIIIIIIIIIK